MKYCHTTKGVSKLEKQLIPFLEKFQFTHFMLFGKPPTNEFNGLCPDFINREQKIIIELFGDYWHANPQRFKPQDYIKQLKLTSGQIWLKDKERLQQFHLLGYKTIVLWEKDVRKHIKLNTIHEFIQLCLLHIGTKNCTNDGKNCG
jgi:G:T-mismatch repair DNA endonuclease (very short patch repair protein)